MTEKIIIIIIIIIIIVIIIIIIIIIIIFSLTSVRENVCNNSKNVKSHIFGFRKKRKN